jgi:hypothetical protein
MSVPTAITNHTNCGGCCLEDLVLRNPLGRTADFDLDLRQTFPGTVFHAIGGDLSPTLAGNVTRLMDRFVTVLRAIEIDQDPFRALV